MTDERFSSSIVVKVKGRAEKHRKNLIKTCIVKTFIENRSCSFSKISRTSTEPALGDIEWDLALAVWAWQVFQN